MGLTDPDSRFWIVLNPEGYRDWFGIVDEECGGIIAYATSEDHANSIVDSLQARELRRAGR